MRVLAGVCVLCLLSASCQRGDSGPREKTFLSVEEPVRASGLVPSALVRTSDGALVMASFIHSSFPSATEPHDAISVSRSSDGGATWEHVSNVPSFVTYGAWGFDLAVDEKDRLYLTWVASVYDAESRRVFKAIMFSRSADRGKTWTAAVRVSDPQSGQRMNPTLAVSGNDSYIAWLEAGRGAGASALGLQDVYFDSSRDRGATWSSDICLEKDLDKKDSSSSAPSLRVGSDGTVYCAYFSIRKYEKKKGGFWIARSADRGATFSMEMQDVGPLGQVWLAERDGELYLATVYIRGIKSITMQNPETYQEIRFYASSDGGRKWTKPVVVDDDETHRHKMNIQLASLEDGKLVAFWDDDRGGVHAAASVDSGKRWGKNVRVAGGSHMGSAVLDAVADDTSGTFYLCVSDVVEGAGDATYLVKGQIEP
jgi:hypothetical protein